jgi:hypothetical protein
MLIDIVCNVLVIEDHVSCAWIVLCKQSLGRLRGTCDVAEFHRV